MSTPPAYITDKLDALLVHWANSLGVSDDVETFMDLWAEDGVYMLADEPVLQGKEAIRAKAVAMNAHLKSVGGSASTFKLTFLADPQTADNPGMVALIGEQNMTVAGQTSKAVGHGTFVLVGGQWKIKAMAMVQADPALMNIVHATL